VCVRVVSMQFGATLDTTSLFFFRRSRTIRRGNRRRIAQEKGGVLSCESTVALLEISAGETSDFTNPDHMGQIRGGPPQPREGYLAQSGVCVWCTHAEHLARENDAVESVGQGHSRGCAGDEKFVYPANEQLARHQIFPCTRSSARACTEHFVADERGGEREVRILLHGVATFEVLWVSDDPLVVETLCLP